MAKGAYIGVDNIARKIKKGYIGVDGVGREVKKGYIGVNGVARECFGSSFEPVFANNTWEQIILACQTRQVPDTWQVGDQKVMEVKQWDGYGTYHYFPYQIIIIGKNHDDYSDGSGKAPLTFQFGSLNHYGWPWVSRSGLKAWDDSFIRTTSYFNDQYINGMPSAVSSALREVNKTVYDMFDSAVRTTADKIFLLSEKELFGASTPIYNSNEQSLHTQYEYYALGNSKNKSKVYLATATENSNYRAYEWLRTSFVDSNQSSRARVVTCQSGSKNRQYAYAGSGDYGAYGYVTAPAFCF